MSDQIDETVELEPMDVSINEKLLTRFVATQ